MVSCRPLVHVSGTHDALSCPQRHLDSGVYWLRKRVPDDLQQVVVSGRREEKRSLGTRNPEEAKRRHAEVLSEIEAQWANLRRGTRSLTPEEIESVAALLCRAPRAGVKRDLRVALELRHRLACDQFVAHSRWVDALPYPSGKRVIVIHAREGNTLSAVFCASPTHISKCTVVSADDCDWNDLQAHQPFSKRTACQRKSRASAQTPATDSLAALARRPLSLAIVTKRKPERIMRPA